MGGTGADYAARCGPANQVWSGLVWSGTVGWVSGRIVNITEAKAQLSRLVAEVAAGGRVVIGNAGKPVAVLAPYTADPSPRQLGGWRGQQVRIAEDFDAALPPDLQAGFDGEA